MRDRFAACFSEVVLLSVFMMGCAVGSAPPQAHSDAGRSVAAPSIRDSTRQGFPANYQVLRNPDFPASSTASGYDILHADIDLSFDFERPKATGQVTYYLVVLRGGLADIRLDAKGLIVDSVRVVRSGRKMSVRHEMNASGISVRPSTPFERADTVSLAITYSAFGAVEAADPGFHFADPGGDNPFVPDQVWAGGVEARSWLPTWDHPAERMTFTLAVTVPDSLYTLASGELVNQEPEGPAHRRDIWAMDSPQPASRIGFAVGTFVLIADQHESPVGKRSSLVYAVDPDPRLESAADAVFSPVPIMMSVIERRTAIEYPFNKYAQVSVWQHAGIASGVAGLAILDRSVLRDRRALLDDTGETLLMRTLASQWFGSWITVGDAADSPLLEGMQRLFEWTYLADVGRDVAAEELMIRTRERYLDEASLLRRPVILRNAGSESGSMDSHSARKAALVLSQLGFVIGDEAWWRAIRDFTARGARLPMTLGDLRESMEQAARRPLTEYFDQWFLIPGHPELILNHEYDQDIGIYTLRIRQVQDSTAFPTFVFETDVEFSFESRPPYRERITISTRDTTLKFGVSGRISFARIDTEGRLLADVRESKPLSQWLAQAEQDSAVAGRYAAARYLRATRQSTDIRDTLVRIAEQDPSPLVRVEALDALRPYARSGLVLRFLFDRSRLDGAPECRSAALGVLEVAGDAASIGAFRRALRDSSYQVVAAAIQGLNRLEPESFWTVVSPLAVEPSWNGVLDLSILRALETNPTPRSAGYLRDRMEPRNREKVRLAALTAFGRLASVDRSWKTEVKSTVQALVSDRNIPVRTLAREILRTL